MIAHSSLYRQILSILFDCQISHYLISSKYVDDDCIHDFIVDRLTHALLCTLIAHNFDVDIKYMECKFHLIVRVKLPV